MTSVKDKVDHNFRLITNNGVSGNNTIIRNIPIEITNKLWTPTSIIIWGQLQFNICFIINNEIR
jgi:hypothetical protein